MFGLQPAEKAQCLCSCDVQKMTPLHCAAMFDRSEIVQYLVEEVGDRRRAANDGRVLLSLLSLLSSGSRRERIGQGEPVAVAVGRQQVGMAHGREPATAGRGRPSERLQQEERAASDCHVRRKAGRVRPRDHHGDYCAALHRRPLRV